MRKVISSLLSCFGCLRCIEHAKSYAAGVVSCSSVSDVMWARVTFAEPLLSPVTVFVPLWACCNEPLSVFTATLLLSLLFALLEFIFLGAWHSAVSCDDVL